MHESKGVGKQNTLQELTPTRGTGPPPAISTILDTRRARSHAITAQKDDLQTHNQQNNAEVCFKPPIIGF